MLNTLVFSLTQTLLGSIIYHLSPQRSVNAFKRPIPLLMLTIFEEHNGGVSYFFAHGSNHSCGMMILMKSDLDYYLR